jgi:hypothetical protein
MERIFLPYLIVSSTGTLLNNYTTSEPFLFFSAFLAAGFLSEEIKYGDIQVVAKLESPTVG